MSATQIPFRRPAALSLPDFLQGEGIAKAQIRNTDWHDSPLGPVALWPQSLKTTLGILLHSKHPMLLLWGPQLLRFYNDAFLPSLGPGREPPPMGQPATELWREIWPLMWPQIDEVMRHGKASWSEDRLVPITRNGRVEDVFWSYGPSPVFDESGAIAGTLIVCMETTQRVLSDRRQQALHQLVGCAAASDPLDVIRHVGSALAQVTADIPFAVIYAGQGGDAPALKVHASGLDEARLQQLDAAVSQVLDDMPAPAEPDASRPMTAKGQVDHLIRLVDDLLDVSKITRGKVELRLECLEIADVLAKAVEMASMLLEQRKHALTIEVSRQGLQWQGDSVRLAQVVANLLTNAARYTPTGGQIALRAWREQGHIVISVRDNGIGIPAELLPHIFELFVQGHRGTDRTEGGLGIGLALVKNLVELHGGSVTAHSDGPGLGSEFIIRLPSPVSRLVAGPEQTGREAGSPRPVPQRSSMGRVLVVDDNRDAGDSLAEVLRAFGHTVRVAADPLSALARADEFEPQVAVLDIGLPGMDGYELARRIRETPGGASCRLIALSGYGQDRDRRRSQEAGFEAHLAKPADMAQLKSLLESLPAERAAAQAEGLGKAERCRRITP